MLIPERVSFNIAESGFISVTLMLKDIVVLVVEELDGERMETFGRVVSRVTERLVEPAKLPAVSLTQTLNV